MNNNSYDIPRAEAGRRGRRRKNGKGHPRTARRARRPRGRRCGTRRAPRSSKPRSGPRIFRFSSVRPCGHCITPRAHLQRRGGLRAGGIRGIISAKRILYLDFKSFFSPLPGQPKKMTHSALPAAPSRQNTCVDPLPSEVCI